MNLSFPAIDTNTSGAVTHYDVPIGRYLGESYDEGVHSTVLESLSRMYQITAADADPSSPILEPDDANKKYAVGDLSFDTPVRESVAKIMNQRKKDEMSRQFFLQHGSSAARLVPGLLASAVGGISNPLDAGLMLVPFVGEEAAAARATSVIGKMLARRLITREALREAVPAAPKLAEAVINGVVGQSLFEGPNLLASMQDHADYGFQDSMRNIVIGGLFAAAIHGVHTAWDTYRVSRAKKLLNSLDSGTREEMARVALNQIMRDEPIRVDNFVKLDDAAILEKMHFDEDAARQRAYASIDMDELARLVRETYGERVKGPAVQLPDNSIHEGYSHETILEKLNNEGKLSPEHAKQFAESGQVPGLEGFVTDSGRMISREEAGKLVGVPDLGYNHGMWENDKLISERISTANPEQLGAAEYDRYNQLLEENPHFSKVDAMKQIMAEREKRRDAFLKSPFYMGQPHIQEKLEAFRLQAIRDFIESERRNTFAEAKRKEIERQIAEGKTLPPEDIQRAVSMDNFSTAEVDKDIEGLKKSVTPPQAKSPDAVDSAINKLNEWIKKLNEWIKNLNKPGNKLFTGVTGLEPLIAMVGKEVAKGLLVALREGLNLYKNLDRAIDHAMKWLDSANSLIKKIQDQHDQVRSHLKSAVESEAPSPDFVYQIESQLDKPVPWDTAPDRFTPQTIMKRVGQLPAGEQAFLKKAGIEKWLEGQKVVDPEKFKEFVKSALPQIEIRPMLNVASDNEYGKVSYGRASGGYLQNQHNLETLGYAFDSAGEYRRPPNTDKFLRDHGVDPDNPDIEKLKEVELANRDPSIGNQLFNEIQYLESGGRAKKQAKGDVLVDDFVSQNVSVPIPFEKMEKPRTVFLAAPQDMHVGSSHYGEVKFGEKKYQSAVAEVGRFGIFDENGRLTQSFKSEKAFEEKFKVDTIFDEAGPFGGPELGEKNFRAHYFDKTGRDWKQKDFSTLVEAEKFRDKLLAEARKDARLVTEKDVANQDVGSHSMLAWSETRVATLPDGRRALEAYEVQSDVRQMFSVESAEKYIPGGESTQVMFAEDFERNYPGSVPKKRTEFLAGYISEYGDQKYKNFETKQEAQAFVDQKLREYQERAQPHIAHTDEILLKALVKLAQREGLDGVVIPDPRTAMLTQGHLGGMEGGPGSFDDPALHMDDGTSGIVEDAHYEPPSQAGGMQQGYGQKLPGILKKLTGKEGEPVITSAEKHYRISNDFGRAEYGGPEGGHQDVQRMALAEFNRAFPGSDSPSGLFFPVNELPNKPFEMFSPKVAESFKPRVESIDAAVGCILKKLI